MTTEQEKEIERIGLLVPNQLGSYLLDFVETHKELAVAFSKEQREAMEEHRTHRNVSCERLMELCNIYTKAHGLDVSDGDVVCYADERDEEEEYGVRTYAALYDFLRFCVEYGKKDQEYYEYLKAHPMKMQFVFALSLVGEFLQRYFDYIKPDMAAEYGIQTFSDCANEVYYQFNEFGGLCMEFSELIDYHEDCR
jgi:hypothetical protein